VNSRYYVLRLVFSLVFAARQMHDSQQKTLGFTANLNAAAGSTQLDVVVEHAEDGSQTSFLLSAFFKRACASLAFLAFS
jgi:hypothetical protein